MEIHSVQEFIELIEKIKKNYTYTAPFNGNLLLGQQEFKPSFIYRGHGNHKKYALEPGIFRYINQGAGHSVSQYSQLEYDVLMDFISEAKRYNPDVPENDITAWLEIAQHFSVPTRLLDFTENPLVALYFACSDLSEHEASVWILNRPAYNLKFFGNTNILAVNNFRMVNQIVNQEIVYQDYQYHAPLYYVQYPVIYKPIRREERMSSQSSLFMLWGAQRLPLTNFVTAAEYISFDDTVNNADHGILGFISIPSSLKPEILQQLNLLGINEMFIYPGLDGVGKYINQKYSSSFKK